MAPRPARVGAYLPPHLRAGTASAAVQQRSLDELAPLSIKIKVEFTPGGPFTLEDYPDPVAGEQEQAEAADMVQGDGNYSHAAAASNAECVRIESPSCPDGHQMAELLKWFAAASAVPCLPDFPQGDTRAVLSLPATLSKNERARWHAAAQKLGLISMSTGVGSGRFLQIRNKNFLNQEAESCKQLNHQQPHASGRAMHASGAAPSASMDRLKGHSIQPQLTTGMMQKHDRRSQKFWQRVKQVWEWCQAEGGSFWNYSQNEISQLLDQQDHMPDEVALLIQKREASQALCRALQGRDESAALAVLCAGPAGSNLAWVRDQESGGYPAHIAAYGGMAECLQKLIDLYGVNILQQQDARRHTPITVARQQGHQQLAEHLELLRLEGLGTAASSGRSVDICSSNASMQGVQEEMYNSRVSSSSSRSIKTAEPVVHRGLAESEREGGDGKGKGMPLPDASSTADVSSQQTADVSMAAAALERLLERDTADYCSSGHHKSNTVSGTVSNAVSSSLNQDAAGRGKVPVSGNRSTPAGVAEQHHCEHYCSYETRSNRSFALSGRGRGTNWQGGGGNLRGKSVEQRTEREGGW